MGSSDVRYSVLTTNFEKADVLERSLESVLCALPDRSELIVVDGGSNDGSIDLLRALEARDDRVRVIVSPSNLGEGRQLAFEHARGALCVQHVDTDRLYEPEIAALFDIYGSLATEHSDLVLCTLDSLYVSRPEPVRAAGGWPPLGRVEERLFVERLCESGATLRVLPVSLSRELPTADTAGALSRARKWRATARDLRRVGFSLPAILRYDHEQFSLPKAVLADLLAVLGSLDAREQPSIPVVPGAPRTSDVVDSWQSMLRYSPEFLPDGADSILPPSEFATSLPATAWIDTETL